MIMNQLTNGITPTQTTNQQQQQHQTQSSSSPAQSTTPTQQQTQPPPPPPPPQQSNQTTINLAQQAAACGAPTQLQYNPATGTLHIAAPQNTGPQSYYYQTATTAQQTQTQTVNTNPNAAASQAQQLYHYQIIKSPSPNASTLQPFQALLSTSPVDQTTANYLTQTYSNQVQTTVSQQQAKAIDNNNNNTYTTNYSIITATPAPPQQQPTYQTLTNEQQILEYMHQLLEEKEKLKELYNEPYSFILPISAKLLDEEISRVRVNLFQLGSKESVCLPEPVGPSVQLCEKLYVPVKDHPEFNFVGRILGPRGMTAKQLEQETGCKIMVRGKGSMRDKAKEEQMKGKPNWEHLNDELHVLITVEDSKNRAEIKLKRAVEEIKKLLVPAPEGEDELKKKQLMELAIINGTYRDSSKVPQKVNQIFIPGNAAVAATGGLRSPPNPIGQPLIISPRITTNSVQTQNNSILNGGGQLIQSADPSTGLIYTTTIPTLYSDPNALNAAAAAAAQQTILDYQNGLDFSQAVTIPSILPSVYPTYSNTAPVR